jgi:hypothetical protein
VVEENYCIRVRDATPWAYLDERMEYHGDLEAVERVSTDEGLRCVYFKVEARWVLVCSDGERFRLAYRVKC